ncbi:D-2-hydroxyacid dehydrogenase [Alteromonas facilis]|uniref:D-2-hydroxyacid dehydrogenase n=1 Tax=Alteromonas facilis TaxID=2048004 RepID=UPI001F0BFB2F|nr:D-2-hydroxyacid dehydrogenase [Alteromonas facilis]
MVNKPMRGVILDMDSLDPASLDISALADMTNIDWHVHAATAPEHTAQRIVDAHIVLTNKVVLDAQHIANASALEYIGVLATGMNNVDHDACRQRGITLTNVSGYGTPSVAQHTLLLMLMLATSVRDYQRDVSLGAWSRSPQFCLMDYPISELAGKTLLLVGYGTLGKAVAKLAHAFDMNVMLARRPGVHASEYNESRVPLDEGLAQADFVSLHCALSAETEKLIDKTRLALMRPSAFLINTARGGLIDEPALVEALKRGALAGAAVDVLSQEPPDSTHIMLQEALPNLIVTPHIAWAARESRQRLFDQAMQHVQHFISQRMA